MGPHFASLLFLLSGLYARFPSDQDVPAAAGQVEAAPLPPSAPPPTVFPERPVSWKKLVPNLARDQKDIWLFPISRAIERHLKPELVLTAITAGTIAAVDVPSGKYFQRTRSFDGFNRTFSGKNTSVAMLAAPSVFYGISLLRKDSHAQHTLLLAGEAVMSSEVLTSVMKDVDRRMKPNEVPLNGDFSDTWFRSHSGSVMRGIGSFPSGHTISAFSLATVFADRHPNPRWHAWVAYSLATAVGFSRVFPTISSPVRRLCRGGPWLRHCTLRRSSCSVES